MFPIPFNFPFRKKDGSLITIDDAISSGGGGGGYTLPTASAITKGGVKIGSGLSMSGEVLNNSNPTPYSLPTASAETLGGVKVGSGLSITDGVLSNSNPTPYSLPTASAETLGGVKVGSGLTMSGESLKLNKTTYEPTLENGISGTLRFVKDADTGLITLVGTASLTTPMTNERVKIASTIDEAFRCGSDGYKQGAFFACGVSSQGGDFIPVSVRVFGSGNVWLYPLDTSMSVSQFYVSGNYYTDVYMST